MWRTVLLGVVVAGLVAGCSLGGGSGGAASAVKVGVPEPLTGTVSGLVVVEGGKDPMFGGSDINPVKRAFVLVTGRTTAGAKVDRHLTCDMHGRFRVRLNPGHYTFLAQIFPANPTHPRKLVVVERGQNSHIVLKGYVI
jgi:hypothetical protein